MDRTAGDPAGVVGGKEGNYSADVVGLRETLQSRHVERVVAACIGLGEVGRVGLNDTWGDGIHPDATSSEDGREMLHQRIDGAFRRGVGRQRADDGTRRKRGQQGDAASFVQDRQKLLHEEEGRPGIDDEEMIEILNRVVLDGGGLGSTGIGDEDIQPVAHDGPNLFSELVRPVGRRGIGGDGIGTAAGLADFRRSRSRSSSFWHRCCGCSSPR
jgi:hypothetical protein